MRIFPLVVQGTGDPVPYLGRLRRDVPAESEIRKVPYEFQRDANTMLVVTSD